MGDARRDFLKFAGGSLLGLGLTPVPWKLLDDSAIWTQNWSWIPKVPRGEISFRQAACTLCARGCALKVRCAGTQPVGIAPEQGSALCALGWTVHQAAYHPARVRRGSAALEEAAKAVISAISAGATVAIVDPAPGRIASGVYRKFAASVPNALYIAEPEPRTLRAFERMAGLPYRSVGADLSSVRTLIAVDAPVLEDWGAPGLLMRRRDEVHVIWSGESPGVTAELANDRVPFRAIEGLLHRVEKPALVVGGEHLPWETHVALAGMNRELGGLAFRREADEGASPVSIPSISDGAIGVLIVEGFGVPFAPLRRKLSKDCLIVAVSAFENEYTKEAKLVIPAPAPLEALSDVPTPFDSPVSTQRIAPAVMTADGKTSMPDFLALAAGTPTYEQAVEERLSAIHASGRGSAKGTSLEDFLSAMKEGAVWTDDAQPMPRLSHGGSPAPEEPSVSRGRRLLTPLPLLADLRKGAVA